MPQGQERCDALHFPETETQCVADPLSQQDGGRMNTTVLQSVATHIPAWMMQQQHVESVLGVVERYQKHSGVAAILILAGILRLLTGWPRLSPSSKKHQASWPGSLDGLAVFETRNDVWAKIQEGHSKACTNPSLPIVHYPAKGDFVLITSKSIPTTLLYCRCWACASSFSRTRPLT